MMARIQKKTTGRDIARVCAIAVIVVIVLLAVAIGLFMLLTAFLATGMEAGL